MLNGFGWTDIGAPKAALEAHKVPRAPGLPSGALPVKPSATPATRKLQNEQLGSDPEVVKVLVVTFVPDGVMFELSRNTVAS